MLLECMGKQSNLQSVRYKTAQNNQEARCFKTELWWRVAKGPWKKGKPRGPWSNHLCSGNTDPKAGLEHSVVEYKPRRGKDVGGCCHVNAFWGVPFFKSCDRNSQWDLNRSKP